jgi:acyl-CoA hydrolase
VPVRAILNLPLFHLLAVEEIGKLPIEAFTSRAKCLEQISFIENLCEERNMEGKRVNESSVILSHVMMPQDANPAGNIHGGVIMKHIDEAAGVVAFRHTRSNVVTAAIERLEFHHPVFIGNLLTLKASIHMVGNTSMEIGVRAETEDLFTGEVRHTVSAYLTYVALDEEGRPKKVLPLILESEGEMRRNREARMRRESRLSETPKIEPRDSDP